MGREVTVTEAEPGRLAVAVERVHDAEALVGEAPALLGVLGAGERVGHGVEVGRDGEAVEAVVVGGVHHDGDRAGSTTRTSPRGSGRLRPLRRARRSWAGA